MNRASTFIGLALSGALGSGCAASTPRGHEAPAATSVADERSNAVSLRLVFEGERPVRVGVEEMVARGGPELDLNGSTVEFSLDHPGAYAISLQPQDPDAQPAHVFVTIDRPGSVELTIRENEGSTASPGATVWPIDAAFEAQIRLAEKLRADPDFVAFEQAGDDATAGQREARNAAIMASQRESRALVEAQDDPARRAAFALMHLDFFARFAYERGRVFEPSTIAWALEIVPLDHPIWTVGEQQLLSVLFAFGPEAMGPEVERLLGETDAPGLTTMLLFAQLMWTHETLSPAEIEQRLVRMAQIQASSFYVEMARAEFDPTRPLAQGRPMPTFDFEAFDDAAQGRVRSEDFGNKPTLMVIWSPWCGFCRAKMPQLHAAYAACSGQAEDLGPKVEHVAEPAVAFVSIDDGDDPEAVREYRSKWPMPWPNVVLTEAQSEQMRASWRVMAVPTITLFDETGRVVVEADVFNVRDVTEVLHEQGYCR